MASSSSITNNPPFTVTEVNALDFKKSPLKISTGIGFFDHMLDQFNSHAQIGVSVKVSKQENEDSNTTAPYDSTADTNRYGDNAPLQEKIMGQVGKALGEEFYTKILSSLPVPRQSRFCCPLDEALVECTLMTKEEEEEGELKEYFLAPFGIYPKSTGRTKIGCMTTAYVETFFSELAKSAKLDVTLRKIRGHNGHHIVESAFKAFSRAIRNLVDGTNTSFSLPTTIINGTTDNNDNDGMAKMWGLSSESHRQSLALKRFSSSQRQTKETSIDVSLQLDGASSGISIDTGIDTLNTFYNTLAREANLSLDVKCQGDTWVDDHHTSEDVSIAIGKVLNVALGTKAGLNRMWCATAKVGDTHVEVTMDLSNRPCFNHGLASLEEGDQEYVGDMSMEMFHHIIDSLVMNGQMTVHVDELSKGNNNNGMDLISAVAMSFGRALRFCSAVDPRRAGKTASSKGTLSA